MGCKLTTDEVAYIDRTIADLKDENAKLRELARDMWRGATTRMDFAERHAFCGEFVDRMRELGVSGHD